MATRVRTRGSDLYEQDFYAWAREQATLLRAGRYDELDLEHLTEEVEDLGGSLYRSVRSRVRTIIEHLLSWSTRPPPSHAVFGTTRSTSSAPTWRTT